MLKNHGLKISKKSAPSLVMITRGNRGRSPHLTN
jgi:hypothetical protein